MKWILLNDFIYYMICGVQEEETDEEDPCLLDKNFGLCKANIKRFYFDKISKECKRLNYGGSFIILCKI